MISVSSAPSTVSDSAVQSIPSLILGELTVTPDVVMQFPTPLWGFPSHSAFALLPAAREGLFWLQSMSGEGVTFLLADPFVLDANYAIDLGDTERQALQVVAPSDALSLVMVSLPSSDGDEVTGNFRAPLVFNVAQRVGMQVVSRDESHELRRPITLDVFPAQANGVRML